MIGMIIHLIILVPFIGFMIVYRWFNMKCMYCINRNNLNRVAIE